ncbi:MAG: right-handed parallel beta-helix repeat-containing protein [Lachnospiraceae bacterium]|nr:right-handed parallel beta-helix repeat-containing protein [Lachnospiraceae bacterium]
MQVLDYLNQKKIDTVLKAPHPLLQASYTFKSNYAFGLAVLVYGAKEQFPITLECLSSILNSLQVDSDTQKKLETQVHNHFDSKIREVFRSIITKDEQYCFIADLLRLTYFGTISNVFASELTEGYMQVFNFSNAEKNFIKNFTDIGCQIYEEKQKQNSSYIDTKEESAIRMYQYFIETGYEISPSILSYIYPDFSLDTTFRSLLLEDGKLHHITSNTYIDGSVQVCNSSTLLFDHASVWINEPIKIDYGKIIIKNSDIHIMNTASDYAIYIENSPAFCIENSTIDCQNHGALIYQESGYLKIQQSVISNTCGEYAILFSGSVANINTTRFSHCQNGAIKNLATQELFLASCQFTDCQSIHGGAVYSNSPASSTIYNCEFQNCHAKYIGGAVYFAQLRYGQRVLQCSYENCTPVDSVLFNNYECKET